MPNDKPPTAETQPNGQKFSNVIELKLNGPATTVAPGCNFHSHSVELPADKGFFKSPADNGAAAELQEKRSNGAEPPKGPLAKAHWMYRRWLGPEYDMSVLNAALATTASYRFMSGDPVWLIVLGGSGNGKTETIIPLEAADLFRRAPDRCYGSHLEGRPRMRLSAGRQLSGRGT